MKSKGLATLFCILFVQIVNGQQNGLVNNQNIDINSILLQQQPSLTTDNGQLLNNNVPLNNQHQQTSINIPKQQLKTDLQPQDAKQQLPLLQQYLLPQQPLMVKQSLRLEQPIQTQKTLIAEQPLQGHHALKPQQAPAPHSLQVQQSLQSQQPFNVQQNIQQQIPAFNQKLDLGQTAHLAPKNNLQTSRNSQLNLKLVPSNLQANINTQPLITKTLNVQAQQNSITRPAEVVSNLPIRQTYDKSLDVSSTGYKTVSQQFSPSTPTTAASVSQNPPNIVLTSYNIKPVDQTYISSYSYKNPNLEIQPTLVERTQAALPSISALPSVLSVPSTLLQNSNSQTYYYNPQTGDTRQNVYVNQNSGYRYPQQSPLSLAIQNQPTAALIPNHSSVLSSVPMSIFGTSVFPQYAVSSTYPVNTIMAPAYISQPTKPSNLKSFLPLIFNLLKEKIASSGCRNGCPDECKNKSCNNIPEVSSGYSSKKHYGALNDDGLFIENVSEESDSAGCLRERKNCLKIEKDHTDISEETLEDEDSDEEENEDDDDSN